MTNQRDMRIQRQIQAEARMREVVKNSVHWPDPEAKKTGVMLKPIHVGKDGKRITESLIQAAKQTTERDVA